MTELAIEYQVPELKTIWEQYDVLWIRGLGGYIRMGKQNICRITLRKSKVDKDWNDPLFLNKNYDKGHRSFEAYKEKFEAYKEAFVYHYFGYEFRILSLITGEKISGFYATWNTELNCDTLVWDESPNIEDMLKSSAKWYNWIEVWCK